MAVDIGVEAINRPSSGFANFTSVIKDKPASISGTITSIDIWANADITGLRVGTFYVVSGNTLKCRASQAIAGTITAGGLVNKAVSIAVEIGDYIGCYFTGGPIEVTTGGYDGLWYKSGEYIDPNDEEVYTLQPGWTISLGGYFGVPGWTGKISGVTNPAKIMGVDVANIHSVKGVVSG